MAGQPQASVSASSTLRDLVAHLEEAALSLKFRDVPIHKRSWALAQAFVRRLLADFAHVTDEVTRSEHVTFQQHLIDALSLTLTWSSLKPTETDILSGNDNEAVECAIVALNLALDLVVANDCSIDFDGRVCLVEGDDSNVRVIYPRNPAVMSDMMDQIAASDNPVALINSLRTELETLPASFQFGKYTARDMAMMLELIAIDCARLMRDGEFVTTRNVRRWARRLARTLRVSSSACESMIRDLTFSPLTGKADVQPFIPIDRNNVIVVPALLFGINLTVIPRRMWTKLYPREYSKTFGSQAHTSEFEAKVRKAIGRLQGCKVAPRAVRLPLPVPVITRTGERREIEIDVLAFSGSASTMLLGEVFEAVSADTPQEWRAYRAKLDGKVNQLKETMDCLDVTTNLDQLVLRAGLERRPDNIVPVVIAKDGYAGRATSGIPIVSFSTLERLIAQSKEFRPFTTSLVMGDFYALPVIETREFELVIDYSGLISSRGLRFTVVANRAEIPPAVLNSISDTTKRA